MVTITYPHQIAYSDTVSGHFAMLQFGIEALTRQTEPIDVDAYLDSGARFSLFDGSILRPIGLDIWDGPNRAYYPVTGPPIEARVLPVRLLHDFLGDFELEIGFSLNEISRNLLGRDFFDRIQIGFREHQLTFYVNPAP